MLQGWGKIGARGGQGQKECGIQFFPLDLQEFSLWKNSVNRNKTPVPHGENPVKNTSSPLCKQLEAAFYTIPMNVLM